MSSIVYSCFGAPVWAEQEEKSLDEHRGSAQQFCRLAASSRGILCQMVSIKSGHNVATRRLRLSERAVRKIGKWRGTLKPSWPLKRDCCLPDQTESGSVSEDFRKSVETSKQRREGRHDKS